MLLKDLRTSMQRSEALKSGNNEERNKFIADLKDSFFPVADKDKCSKEALGYANNIANAIINNIPLKTEHGEFTHSILSTSARNAAVGRDQESIVKNTINYLGTIMKYLNDPGLRGRIKDDKVFANPQRVSNYVRFLLMAEFSDQVLSDCGNNPDVATALKNLKENPNFKYIKARIEAMTNPYFARFYDNGKIYSNAARFAPENVNKRQRNENVKIALRDMHRNLSIMESGIDPYADIANDLEEFDVSEAIDNMSVKVKNDIDQFNRNAGILGDKNLPDPKILKDFFSANGISDPSQASFFNPDGSLIGNYEDFSKAVTNLDKPDFFVGTPGGPLVHLENTITPRLNSNIQFAEKAAGDPYENIFKSGTPEANGLLSNAHISYGSKQFAEMERLFNEYNALVSQPGFDQIRAAELAGQIEKASITYLSFKANQRHSDIDNVMGKNSREQRRIDTARHIRDLFDSKSKLSNNVRRLENIRFADPASALEGVDPTNKEAFEAALNKYLYDTVSPHIAGHIEALKNHSRNYDPFDYIAIDGSPLPAMIRSMMEKNGMDPKDNKAYDQHAPQYACEIIGASLLAKKSVTVHNHDGSLEHLDRPVTLRRAPGNAKVIKNEDYKDFFQGKLRDVGLYKTVFYDTRMQNEAYKTAKDSMKLKKTLTGLANETNDALKKDYLNPWLEKNGKTLTYVKDTISSGCCFSVARTAIPTLASLAAISQKKLTLEEAVTPGANADVKAEFGAAFMDKVQRMHDLSKTDDKNYKLSAEYVALVKDTVESILPAVREGVEYFKNWAKDNDNFSIEKLNTPEGRDFYNRYYTLFDAFQELTRDDVVNALGGKGSNISQEINGLIDGFDGAIATIATAEKASSAISRLFSDNMEQSTGDIRDIICHVAGNMYYDQIRAKNPDDILKLKKATGAEQFSVAALDVSEKYYDDPKACKLIAEMALNGKLKDLISDVKMERGLASFSFNYDAFDKALEAKNAADEKSINSRREELAYHISQRGAEGRSVQKPEKVQDQSISNNKPEGFVPKA